MKYKNSINQFIRFSFVNKFFEKSYSRNLKNKGDLRESLNYRDSIHFLTIKKIIRINFYVIIELYKE